MFRYARKVDKHTLLRLFYILKANHYQKLEDCALTSVNSYAYMVIYFRDWPEQHLLRGMSGSSKLQ